MPAEADDAQSGDTVWQRMESEQAESHHPLDDFYSRHPRVEVGVIVGALVVLVVALALGNDFLVRVVLTALLANLLTRIALHVRRRRRSGQRHAGGR